MTQKSARRIQGFAAVAAVAALIGIAGYAAKRYGTQNQSTVPASTARPPAIVSDYQAPLAGTSGVERELRITPEAVLASVNGHILSAEAVLPPGSSGQSVSREVCEYYRQRAIDRELIFQTASAQHVVLNESQQQQLANLQRLRQQQGPGLVRDLAGGPEELSFELRDDEAFMLQTSLMENSGASPNVTSQQVSDYYQWHIAEFGELPTDEPSRQEAWSRIDFEIRQTLASGVRSDFQRKLADYMQRIKTGANIQLTPLASFANTSE